MKEILTVTAYYNVQY